MTDQALRSRWSQFVVLCVILALNPSCGAGDRELVVEDDDEVEIEGSGLSLVEGRTVEVEQWRDGTGTTARIPLGGGGSRSLLDNLVAACAATEMLALSDGLTRPALVGGVDVGASCD